MLYYWPDINYYSPAIAISRPSEARAANGEGGRIIIDGGTLIQHPPGIKHVITIIITSDQFHFKIKALQLHRKHYLAMIHIPYQQKYLLPFVSSLPCKMTTHSICDVTGTSWANNEQE